VPRSPTPVQYGPGLTWPAAANVYCCITGQWLAVNVIVDFPFGGVMPCKECDELHQVILAAQEEARPPRRADQPDASIPILASYDASPYWVHPPIPKINEMGTWCEICEVWTPYGWNALLGQLIRCWLCGINCPVEHRNGDVFTRAGGLPQRFMLDGRMIMREKLADASIFVPPQIANIDEMGIWCEVCEEWTSYGRNVHLGQLFRCAMCGNHCQAEHRKGNAFKRARGLPQRVFQDGQMVVL
jgi:hypothetical protein